MKSDGANKVKLSLFFLFLIVVIVGGYILMVKSNELNRDNSKENSSFRKEEQQIKEIRKDPKKDYIYFEDPEMIEHELDLEYKNIVINFNDTNNIASILNNETETMRKSLKYDEKLEESSYNNLASADYKKYEIYMFEKYISLVVHYYSFNHETLVNSKGSKTYVFDKESGELFTSDELLNAYNLTKDDVVSKIKTHIADQDLIKDGEQLDADATVAGISEYALYIDKLGKLNIAILVKSDQKDYNDSVILN